MTRPSARFGEHRVLEQLGVLIEGLGNAFGWKSKDLDHSGQLAPDGWAMAEATISAGQHFLVVLDESMVPLRSGWRPLDPVLACLRQRPPQVPVVLAGHTAPDGLIDQALLDRLPAVAIAMAGGVDRLLCAPPTRTHPVVAMGRWLMWSRQPWPARPPLQALLGRAAAWLLGVLVWTGTAAWVADARRLNALGPAALRTLLEGVANPSPQVTPQATPQVAPATLPQADQP